MNRRNFLRSMLGVAAATALPSEVWPFRKIFLPLAPQITRVDFLDLSYWGRGPSQALELEMFMKEIPDLICGAGDSLNIVNMDYVGKPIFPDSFFRRALRGDNRV